MFGTVRSGLFRHFNVGNLDSACAANHSDVAHARAVDIESETLPAGLSRMDIDELSAVPPCEPGYQASTMAGTKLSAQLTDSGLPLTSTSTTGLPVRPYLSSFFLFKKNW